MMMQRRKFIQQNTCVVVGMAVFGNICPAGKLYTGDTPTTTDILGPYYRPGAPFRKFLNPPGFGGEVLHLSGTVFKEDGKTPMPGCLMEMWQCQADGFYDNLSDDYLYRASQVVNEKGNYHFITTRPVAYSTPENPSAFRPAHIHMRISAIGQQDLITQIYFKGDRYLNSDPSTISHLSFNRILRPRYINDKESKIQFDIVLKQEYLPDDAVFQKVSGVYKMNDGSSMEFYRDGDLLFYRRDSQLWGGLCFAGNNSFTGGVNDTRAEFEILPGGGAKIQFRFIRRRKLELEGIKIRQYKC